MTEAIFDVYDIGQPTPVSLKKLSAIAISLEIWRREVNEYRKSHTLEKFDSYRTRLPSKVVLAELPPAIHHIIHKYVKRFAFSLDIWIMYHCDRRIFGSDDNHRMIVFENFDDFVCDYDGAIHYVRTVERMIRCDKFDDVMKFDIACKYFLEDEVRRMWPFVSKSRDINRIDFNKYPQMYYWICRLTNKLDKIIPTRGNFTVDEEMFDRNLHYSMPSSVYFWSGVSREKQMRQALMFYHIYVKNFITTFLPKLDDQQLNEFVNEHGGHLMCKLLQNDESIDEELVLGTWLYIRNILNGNHFERIVADMLKNQSYKMKDDFKDKAGDCDEYNADVVECRNKFTYLCLEIWSNSPPNLKSSVNIRDLFKDNIALGVTGDFNSTHINVELLSLILRSATLDQRSLFWYDRWHLLIAAARGEDLQRIMKLCFETRDYEMAEFKDLIARSDDVRRLCVELLRKGEYFDHLNELVSFMCPEMHNARNFKQQILRSFSIHRAQCRLEPWIVLSAGKFDEFITSVYNEDVDASVDFKNQLMPSSSTIQNVIWSLIRTEKVSVQQLAKFIDTFVPTEEAVVQIKMSITDSIKQCVTATARRRRPNQDMIGKPYFTSILLWCLGSDEEVDKFKLSCAS